LGSVVSTLSVHVVTASICCARASRRRAATTRSLFTVTDVGTDPSRWNKLAILISHQSISFFVNDRKVGNEIELTSVSDFLPDGIVDVGAISTNTVFTQHEIRCRYDDLTVYQR
jgi:hypothetical protein